MRTPSNERLTSDILERDGSKTGSARTRTAKMRGKEADPKGEAERRCVLTGDRGARGDLIRLALSPAGLVLPDLQAKAPGRGAWIVCDRQALENALSDGQLRRALARAFKTGEIEIPAELPDQIETGLRKLALDRLGLELRCGNLLLGSQKIDRAAREGRVHALYHAADASADGAAKLDQAWRVGSDEEGSGLRGPVLPLDRAALSVALGRENVVHLAVSDAGAASRIGIALARLARFARTGSDEIVAAHAASEEDDDDRRGGIDRAPANDGVKE